MSAATALSAAPLDGPLPPLGGAGSGVLSGGILGLSSSSGREILTVNVNQINADLLRQASTVLSQHGEDINELPPGERKLYSVLWEKGDLVSSVLP